MACMCVCMGASNDIYLLLRPCYFQKYITLVVKLYISICFYGCIHECSKFNIITPEAMPFSTKKYFVTSIIYNTCLKLYIFLCFQIGACMIAWMQACMTALNGTLLLIAYTCLSPCPLSAPSPLVSAYTLCTLPSSLYNCL